MTASRTPLSEETALAQGIGTHHERMENGELRFRLMANDGSGYIRTVASETGAWQNSHYHKAVLETYIIQQGWVVFVEAIDQDLTWNILRSGDVYTTSPNVPHNLYLPAHTVIHTVKHGVIATDGDWYSSADLDSRTKHISEAEILQSRVERS